MSWLEQFLAQFRGTVVCVTHDRYFLDNVAGWILELDRGAGLPFEGNYRCGRRCYSCVWVYSSSSSCCRWRNLYSVCPRCTADAHSSPTSPLPLSPAAPHVAICLLLLGCSEWLESKAKRLAGEEKAQSGLKKAIAGELEFIKGHKAKGQQKQGAARVRAYDVLVEQQAAYVKAASVDSIIIPVGPRLGSTVVEVSGVSKAFGDRLLLDGATFSIPPAAVVGIIGGNGAGKSTLFRMMMGAQSPDSGSVVLGETVVPMYVDQSRSSLDPDKTVYDVISEGREEIDLGGRSVNARAYCGWYNFKVCTYVHTCTYTYLAGYYLAGCVRAACVCMCAASVWAVSVGINGVWV